MQKSISKMEALFWKPMATTLSLSTIVSSVTASIPLAKAAQLQMVTVGAERSVNWNEGFWQTRVKGEHNKEWRFCRYRVIEFSRNPNNEPPERGTSGYRIVKSSEQGIEWQVWVKPYGHIFDQQRRWIDVRFEVYFVAANATQDEISAAHCNDLPVAQPPYDPEPPTPGQGVPTNPPPPKQWESVIYLRRFCKNGGYVDTIGLSNGSCQAAKTEAKQIADQYDVCRFPNGPTGSEWNDAWNGSEMWVYTSKCPN